MYVITESNIYNMLVPATIVAGLLAGSVPVLAARWATAYTGERFPNHSSSKCDVILIRVQVINAQALSTLLNLISIMTDSTGTLVTEPLSDLGRTVIPTRGVCTLTMMIRQTAS